MAKKALGKGLNSLFQETNLSSSIEKEAILEIGINEIDPNTDQPRKRFDDSMLEELSSSIKKHGIMQPIIVKQAGDRYMIVAGERRWRASRLAGLTVIPAIVRELSSKQVMEMALIENIQREDLNAIEEAEAYHKLMNEFELTQEQLSETVGKSRSAVANIIRLLSLEPYVRGLVADGGLSSGHGRTLLGLKDSSKQSEIAEKIVENELSVREAESLVKEVNQFKEKKAIAVEPSSKSNDLKNVEASLEEKLGTKVTIQNKPNNKGKLIIEYYSLEDFERIKDVIVK